MYRRRSVHLSLAASLALSFALAASPAPTHAAGIPDRFADGIVDPTSLVALSNAQRQQATGAPDGNGYGITMLGGTLALDMGENEAGTGNLTVYFESLVTLGVGLDVDLLDANGVVVRDGGLQLVNIGIGASSATIPYTGSTPYRYVRINALLMALNIDAVAATDIVDADMDGLPSVWEYNYGLDWLSSTSPNGAPHDPDSDGLTNAQELAAGTDPRDADSDNDGLPDGWEVGHSLDPLDGTGVNGASGDPDGDTLTNAQELTLGTNPRNADTDGDGTPDNQEGNTGAPDTDMDGIPDAVETANGTNPNNPDTDGDGLPDGWEVNNNLNPRDATGENGASGDPDNDGLNNLGEFQQGTNPRNADTDGDGIRDGDEGNLSSDPGAGGGNNGGSADSDGDGLTNDQEIQYGTNPRNADTDGDGLPDGWEVMYQLDPTRADGRNGASGDPDNDRATNLDEFRRGTNPIQSDTITSSTSFLFVPYLSR